MPLIRTGQAHQQTVTTRGRGKLHGSIKYIRLVGRKEIVAPLCPVRSQRLSSRSQDDVDSDISRFKLHYPFEAEKWSSRRCGFQLSERTKVRRGGCASIHFCPASRIWPYIGISWRRAKAVYYSDQGMVPVPPLDNTTRSTGKAWFT